MGGNPSKHRRSLCERNIKGLKEKIRFIQEEVNTESMYQRVKESPAYEKEMMAFAFKKAEWKQERKKLKEEVKMLRALVEEKEDKIREMEEGLVGEKGTSVEKEWAFLGANFLVDQMEQERARRDETIEKWKQLYLAIKMELDDLIQRTHEGGLYWRAEEEDLAEELKRELQAKEETIKELKSRLTSMEQEMYKRDREVDILRQSLRIMSSKKVLQTNMNLQKKTLIKQGGKL
ncbi:golgin family A protein [Trema orientale]|uniref:Golgin family A protein n=1 Tax=Trema orientale TaxID=63057 RepID=A0A2P5FAT1_TREOI|nr:golgin family A protein [Trema orientale]